MEPSVGASRESGPSAPTDIPLPAAAPGDQPAAATPSAAGRTAAPAEHRPRFTIPRGTLGRWFRRGEPAPEFSDLRIDDDDVLVYRDPQGRVHSLPPYQLWRRVPQWEPKGIWMRDRPQAGWPDSLVPTRTGEWAVRILLLVGTLLAELALINDPPWRRVTLLVLALAMWSWCEWWMRWDISSVWRRVGIVVVTAAGTATMTALSPLAGIFAWSFYTICGTFFTGWLMVTAMMLTVPIMNATQLGGFDRIPHYWGLFAGLYIFCVGIGVVATGVAAKREDAVLRRTAMHSALQAEQRRSGALQRDLLSRARLDGITAERGRLARELHDTVAQGLVAVVTQLESIPRGSLPEAASARVENAKTLARQGLDEARRAVYALRPIALDQLDLTDAVAELVEAARVEAGLHTDLRVDGEPRSTPHDAALVRIAQEALSNVRRHSAAQRVTVTLTYLDDELLLDIRDDGRGFDPTAGRHPDIAGGHGLPGMAERMALAGGRLTVESEPGAGCVISAAVPG